MVNISVIVPVYNTEKFIDSCIESVVKQSYQDWELILIDDGSSDNSGSICDKWTLKDNRIQVLHQYNQGRSKARLHGVNNAHGEWCCFIDSDDKIPHDSLQLLSNRTSDDTEIIFGNGYSLGKNYKKTIDIETFRHLAVRGEGTIGVPWGTLFRRRLLTTYVFDVPKDFYMGEDYIFWLRIVFNTNKSIAVVKESVYDKGDDTTSSNFVWTSAYAEKIQQYRIEAIPKNQRKNFLADTISDRIANLCAVAMFENKQKWSKCTLYKQLVEDMQRANISFTKKQRLFLSIPSINLRRLYSIISDKLHYFVKISNLVICIF